MKENFLKLLMENQTFVRILAAFFEFSYCYKRIYTQHVHRDYIPSLYEHASESKNVI